MRPLTGTALLALLVLPALMGCRGGSTTSEDKQQPPAAPTKTVLTKPAVKVADPKGQWTFEATAKTMTTSGVKGPYHMVKARATYQSRDLPPVHMTADRMHVDEAAQQVTLEGSVVITAGALTVEGGQVQYNLKTGKVSVVGQTK